MSITYLYPDADSATYADGTPSSGSDCFAMVDDAQGVPDDDSTYYTLALGSNTKQGVSFDTSGLNANTKIRHVSIHIRARDTDAISIDYFVHIYYSGSLLKISDLMSLTNTYSNHDFPVYFPPGGSDWWSKTELGNLEVVVENISNLRDVIVTQIYLTVDYDDPAAALESGYSDSRTLTITNNSASQLDAGYSVLAEFTGDDAAAIYNGSLDSGNDVRVTYNGAQLHRYIEEFAVGSVKIWFKTQANIAGSGSDSDYSIHYGKSGADTAPAGWTWIFSFPEQTANGEYIMETSGDIRGHGLAKFAQSLTTVDAKLFQSEATASYQPFADYPATMRCLTDTGTNWVGGTGPEVMLKFRKLGTNTVYLHTRSRGQSAASNSLFPRINLSNGTYHDLPGNGWEWNKADVTIATEATHTFGVRAREDGVIFDELLLTENNGFATSGTDPYEAKLSVFRPVQDSEPTVVFQTGGDLSQVIII